MEQLNEGRDSMYRMCPRRQIYQQVGIVAARSLEANQHILQTESVL